MNIKSRLAFIANAEKLKKAGGRTYFWTFTFKELHADWECAVMFADFLRELRRQFPGAKGVRVCELHKSRGVHYHALVDSRLDVRVLRRIGHGFGIGRIHVCVAFESAISYLCKYLWKQCKGPITATGRNARRWSAFGDFVKTRVSDIICESPMWVWRRVRGMTFVGYSGEQLLQKAWLHGKDTFEFCYLALVRGDEGAVFLAIGVDWEVSRRGYSLSLVPRCDKMLARMEEQNPF
jgi:hypothetical protein